MNADAILATGRHGLEYFRLFGSLYAERTGAAFDFDRDIARRYDASGELGLAALRADGERFASVGETVWKQTTKHLTDAIGKLSDAENNDEFWTGAGADGFEDWVTRSKASLQTWTTTIGAAGATSGAFIGALNKASAGVVEFLNGIFQALTELLKGLVAAFGQLGGVAKPGTTGVEIDPAAITGAISSVVTGFLTGSQTALSTAASTLNTYDTAGNDAEAAGQSMIQIRMPGSSLTDLRGHPVKSER